MHREVTGSGTQADPFVLVEREDGAESNGLRFAMRMGMLFGSGRMGQDDCCSFSLYSFFSSFHFSSFYTAASFSAHVSFSDDTSFKQQSTDGCVEKRNGSKYPTRGR